MVGIKRQQGVALIIAIVTSLILALIVAFFVGQSKQVINAQFMMQNKLAAEFKADSTINRAIYFSEKYRTTNLTDTIDSKYPGWNYYNKPFTVLPGVTLSITDEATKVSLQPTDFQLMQLILENFSDNNITVPQVIARLKDWQDQDDLVHLNGMENSDYIRANLAEPRNFTIQSIDELALIPGFKQEWIELIKPYISLFTLSDLNVRLSSEQLIEWLYGKDQAEQTKNVRAKSNLQQGISANVSGGDQDLIETIAINVNVVQDNITVVKQVVFSTKTSINSPYPYEIWHWK